MASQPIRIQWSGVAPIDVHEKLDRIGVYAEAAERHGLPRPPLHAVVGFLDVEEDSSEGLAVSLLPSLPRLHRLNTAEKLCSAVHPIFSHPSVRYRKVFYLQFIYSENRNWRWKPA